MCGGGAKDGGGIAERERRLLPRDGSKKVVFYSVSTCWGDEKWNETTTPKLGVSIVYKRRGLDSMDQHSFSHAQPRSPGSLFGTVCSTNIDAQYTSRQTHSQCQPSIVLLTRCFFSLSLSTDTTGTLHSPTTLWLPSCLLVRVFRITGPMVCRAPPPPAGRHVHHCQADMFIPPKSTWLMAARA